KGPALRFQRPGKTKTAANQQDGLQRKTVASSGRFELPAPRVGGECSIQLSDEDTAGRNADPPPRPQEALGLPRLAPYYSGKWGGRQQWICAGFRSLPAGRGQSGGL